MIDVDEMQDYIQAANPVLSPEKLDPDELARFMAIAKAAPRKPDLIGDEPLRRQPTHSRGFALAVATAAIALGAVAIAVVLVRPFDEGELSTDEPLQVATGPTATTLGVPNLPLYTKRLIPVAGLNPPPLSTAIGDLEFEVLEFESSEDALWQVAWAEHSFVSIANGRLYWSTDYYNWESVGPVNGDEVTVAGDGLIVHGGPGNPTRYAWVGDTWVESGLVLAGDVGQFAFGSSGAVALEGDTFLYSSDGVIFNPAEQPPRTRLDAAEQGRCPEGWGAALNESLAATKTGYIALLPTRSAWWSTDPVCEPVVWTSLDGSRWELAATESPFGEDSAIYRVVAREGRVVAAGALPGEPAVIWVSDDGVAWERIDIGLEVIDGVAAGELGWVISGGATGYEHLTMLSADGINWVGPYERPVALRTGYLPPQFAVGDDAILGTGGDGDALLVRVQD